MFRVASFVSQLRLETILEGPAHALAELRRVSSKKGYGLAPTASFTPIHSVRPVWSCRLSSNRSR